ncbi:YhbY family RNA-binding protein [Litorivivens sp.]|uniref:YhbY family RNA-binding protein n=1 Tax=Litorivivens sp. TaxID=2020868 RepID=UPI0035673404
MDTAKRKQLRTIGHKLKPVVMIAGKGVTEGVDAELERALEDHELIKVKLAIPEPADRKMVISYLCETHRAELVQSIGKVALIYRAAKKPNPKLSNLLR